MSRLIVLAFLLAAAGVQTAAAQIGVFPGVQPPVPSPGSSAISQPPIIYTPNLVGRTVAPYLMEPVTPGAYPYSTPILRGTAYAAGRHVRHRAR